MAKKRKGNKNGKSRAQLADPRHLYELAVQSPESDIEFFVSTYQELRGREPTSLREDFCGSAKLAATWCLERDTRSAIGIDIDEDTLNWGRQRNLVGNEEKLGERLQLIHGDVLETDSEPADVVCAMNFSFCVFKTRETLRRYLEVAHRNLAEDGIMIMELYGGTEAIVELEEEREVDDGFTYEWEQSYYNPIDHHTRCHIHFSFPDGSRLKNAFNYDWRLWSVPEVKELLLEAGFSNVRVFWEMVEDEDEDDGDDDGMLEGTGEYEEVTEVENQDSWLVYIIGEH